MMDDAFVGGGVAELQRLLRTWARASRLLTWREMPFARAQLEVTWWVGLPSDSTMYAWGLLYSIPIVIFFIVDQLVSAGLAQPAELRMRKGRYYHSGLLLVGLLNLAGPLFGLPFVTGALPQSPELTIQMAETTAEREKRLELEQQLATAAQQQQPSSEGSTASSGRTGLAASLLGGGKAPAAAEPAAAVPQIDRRPLVIETRLAPVRSQELTRAGDAAP
jgi:hypothetical protein